MSDENKTVAKEVQTALPELAVVATMKFDVSKYVGKKTKIETMKIDNGKFGPMLTVATEVLGQEDGKDIRAQMVFSLKQTEDGIVIPEKGDLNKLMQNKKVTDYRELKNMDVIVLSKADEKGIDWLIFN